MTPLIILCTCPAMESATMIANALVDARLAACVNILPAIYSVYHWQGTRTTSHEVMLVIKAPTAAYEQIEACILARHPYELPEIIAVSIATGLPAYLSWLANHSEPGPL